MTFSSVVKKEILSSKSRQPCCRLAGLSAFIKGAGTLIVENGTIGFSLSGDNEEILKSYSEDIYSLYGIKPTEEKSKKKLKLQFLSDKSFDVLKDTGIVFSSAEGLSVNLGIDKYLVENDCCKREFIKALFLACGTVNIPSESGKSGYHLEFVFSNFVFAQDFCSLMASFDVLSKTVERNSLAVVYYNSVKEILDVLYLLDAKKSMVGIKDVYRAREVSNNINRQMNCELSNINKSVNASITQRNAISLIDNTIGINSLKEELRQVCVFREKYPQATLEELAVYLNISKSCLNHRIRKIMEISKNLQ
ncbi:MAG TPA: DNA-binding protein WhiA [Clostridiales bacterium]|nr:DNA-binding protein WhiA [Clostridiales bacterium]